MDAGSKSQMVFDPIYGLIRLTPEEWEIIHTPYYQRLRWIKQLGFSCLLFHGAEHSRFGHSIGAMYNAHKIIESCGMSCSTKELYSPGYKSKKGLMHKSIRMAALMHDLGTFPFSHTTEGAYIQYSKLTQGQKNKNQDHEFLASIIILKTNFPGGITSILKKHKYDPKELSLLVRGESEWIVANQILHSEVDCDRMDYLLRDSHYTGLKYGAYDRDYLLHHFKIAKIGEQEVLTIRDNALSCVEDFLMARFEWYSQVIRSPRGAKYDAVAEELCLQMLKEGMIYKYEDLINLIQNDSLAFFNFNDSFFMSKIDEVLRKKADKKNYRMKEMASLLINHIPPKAIRCHEFNQKLLNQDEPTYNDKLLKKVKEKVHHIQEIIKKQNNHQLWVVSDIPLKNIYFVQSNKTVVKNKTKENILLERDPVKILFDDGQIKLLGEIENSISAKLKNIVNFIPNVFCNDETYNLLVREGIIKE